MTTSTDREPKITSASIIGPKLGDHQAVVADEQWWDTRSCYGDDWEWVTKVRRVVFCLCKGLEERIGSDVGQHRLPFLEHVVASWYES